MKHLTAKGGKIWYINEEELLYMVENPIDSSLRLQFKTGKVENIFYDVLDKKSPDASNIKSPLHSGKKPIRSKQGTKAV